VPLSRLAVGPRTQRAPGLLGGLFTVGGLPESLPARDVPATLAIVLVFVGLAAGRPILRRLSRHPTAERCAAMLDRYAEQEARAEERRAVQAPPRALDAPEVTACVRDLLDDEVACALRAGWVDELERCLP
jgi:hypothetical protein